MFDSLLKYKNEFAIKFATLMQTQLKDWQDAQKVARKSLYSWGSIAFYLFAGLLGFVPGKNERHYCLKLHIVLAIVFFIGAIIATIQSKNKEYQNKIKANLFPHLLGIFGDIHYCRKYDNTLDIDFTNLSDVDVETISETTDDMNKIIPNSVFEGCQLLPRDITERTDDDVFVGNYNDVEFIMNETDFGWNANDKYHTYHSMFKGLVMKFKLNKIINTRVFIYTHNSSLKAPAYFERVTLESDKFNKKYKVFADNTYKDARGQIEARYLLNTAFIDRLMQIQTSFKVNKLCCTVYGNEMLIFLSTKKDLFEMNHLLGRVDDIHQYDTLFNEFASVLSFIDVLKLYDKSRL